MNPFHNNGSLLYFNLPQTGAFLEIVTPFLFLIKFKKTAKNRCLFK